MSSSSSAFDQKNTTVVKQDYAPEDAGFIHTLNTQFTHFLGSGAGARTTFGMSCESFANLVNSFNIKMHETEANAKGMTQYLLQDLSQLSERISTLAEDLTKGRNYQSEKTMATTLLSTGHIPLIVSGAAAAAQYERAVRSVHAFDLEIYFSKVSSAREQCREYLVKHDMMVQIAKFRKKIIDARYKLSDTDPSFFFCNRLLNKLDQEVIKLNRDSLPKDCEQFDLAHEFAKKIRGFICQLDLNLVGKDLVNKLAEQFKNKEVKDPVTMQKELSAGIYKILKVYLATVGISEEGDLHLGLKEDAILQNLGPLIEYLGSRFNPFAQDGFFGPIATNPFRARAIEAYMAHESKMFGDLGGFIYFFVAAESANPIYRELYFYVYQPVPGNVKYTGEQLEKLLFGSDNEEAEEKADEGFFSRFSSTLLSIISEGSVDSSASNSESSALADRLALPMPQQFLMLEAPKEETDENEEKFIFNNNP